ncbi:MAG TPA: hypothetical protein VGA37_11435 [Gemmatimonadales bacterium]
MMFRQVLYTQWKWSAWAVVTTAVAAFTLPLVSVQRAGANTEATDVLYLLGDVAGVGYMYPFLAVAAGITIALLTWAPDHAGRHVYALSLPVPRWYYALLRYGAGTLLLVPTMLALWIGALVATSSATIPQGLDAYPTAIAFRFALATLFGFSMFFALAAGTVRTAIIALGVAPTAIIVTNQIIISFGGPNLVWTALEYLIRLPGPMELLFEPWMLINV